MQYDNLVFCVDFNLMVNPTLKRTFLVRGRNPSLHRLLHKEDVYDVSILTIGILLFSSKHNSYSHIDKWLLQQVSHSSISDITWSDHTAISNTVEECDSCSPEYLQQYNNSFM